METLYKKKRFFLLLRFPWSVAFIAIDWLRDVYIQIQRPISNVFKAKPAIENKMKQACRTICSKASHWKQNESSMSDNLQKDSHKHTGINMHTHKHTLAHILMHAQISLHMVV